MLLIDKYYLFCFIFGILITISSIVWFIAVGWFTGFIVFILGAIFTYGVKSDWDVSKHARRLD